MFSLISVYSSGTAVASMSHPMCEHSSHWDPDLGPACGNFSSPHPFYSYSIADLHCHVE